MHTHTAFLSSSISAPLLLLRLSLALPHLLPSAHPHRRVRSAARLPPPRRPPCRASPHSRLVGPRLAPPRPFAFPASTPTLPRPPFPARVAVTPPFVRRVLRHGHSLSPLASCLSSHVSISSTPATLPRRPVRPFLFFLFSFFSSLPLLCLLAPIFPPLFPPRVLPLLSHLPLPSTHATIYFHRPRLYPSIVVSFPLPTLRVPFFISFFLSSFLFYVRVRIYFIYIYTYIRIVSRFTGRRAYIE